jgi:hypothetical protein
LPRRRFTGTSDAATAELLGSLSTRAFGRDLRTGAAITTNRTDRRLLAVIATLSVALSGTLAASVSAGTGSTASGRSGFTTPGAASARAKCPSGARSTGGGFKIAKGFQPPPVGTGTRSITQVSAPGGKRTWGAASEGFAATTNTTLTAFARCATDIKSVTLATESATLDVGVARQLQPRCPPVRYAIGGGFKVSPTFQFSAPAGGPLVFPLESRRIGNRDWRVTAANVDSSLFSTEAAGDVTAFALCALGSIPLKSASRTTHVSYSGRATAVARCPIKWHTVSGGFRASPIFDDPTHSLYILPEFDASSPQGSRAWTVSAFDYYFGGNTNSGKFAAYAYCKHN